MHPRKAVPQASKIDKDSGAAQAVKSEDEIRYFFGIFRKNDSMKKKLLKTVFGIPVILFMIIYLGLETFYTDFLCEIPKITVSIYSHMKKLFNLIISLAFQLSNAVKQLFKHVYYLINFLFNFGLWVLKKTQICLGYLKKFLFAKTRSVIGALKKWMKLAQFLSSYLKAFGKFSLRIIKVITFYFAKYINSPLLSFTTRTANFLKLLLMLGLRITKEILSIIYRVITNSFNILFKKLNQLAMSILRMLINFLKLTLETLANGFKILIFHFAQIVKLFLTKSLAFLNSVLICALQAANMALKLITQQIFYGYRKIKLIVQITINKLKQLVYSFFLFVVKVLKNLCRRVFVPMVNFLRTSFILTKNGLLNAINSTSKSIASWSRSLLLKVCSIFTYLLKALYVSINGVLNLASSIISIFNRVGQRIVSYIKMGLRYLFNNVQSLVSKVLRLASFSLSLLKNIAIKIFRNFLELGKSGINNVLSSKLVSFISKTSKYVLIQIPNALSFILKAILKAVIKVSQAILRASQAILEAILKCSEAILGVFQAIGKAVVLLSQAIFRTSSHVLEKAILKGFQAILKASQAIFKAFQAVAGVSKLIVRALQYCLSQIISRLNQLLLYAERVLVKAFIVQKTILRFIFWIIKLIFQLIWKLIISFYTLINKILLGLLGTLRKMGILIFGLTQLAFSFSMKRLKSLFKKFCNVANYLYKHGKNKSQAFLRKLIKIIGFCAPFMKKILVLALKIVFGMPFLIFMYARKLFPKIANILKRLFSTVKSFINEHIIKSLSVVLALFSLIIGTILFYLKLLIFELKRWALATCGYIKTVLLFFKGFVFSSFKILVAPISKLRNVITRRTKELLRNLGCIFKNIKNASTALALTIKNLINRFRYFILAFGAFACNQVRRFFSIVKQHFAKLKESMTKFSAKVIAKLKNFMIKLKESLSAAKNNTLNQIKRFKSHVVKSFKSQMASLASLANKYIKIPLMKLSNSLRNIQKSIRDHMSFYWSHIKNSLIALKHRLAKYFDESKASAIQIKIKISKLISSIKGVFIRHKSDFLKKMQEYRRLLRDFLIKFSRSLKQSLLDVKAASASLKQSCRNNIIETRARFLILKQNIKNYVTF